MPIPAEIVGLTYTNTERYIVEALSDGRPKTQQELGTWDSQVQELTVQVHICNIRKKINESRYRIYSGYENNKLVYRLVTLYNPRLS